MARRFDELKDLPFEELFRKNEYIFRLKDGSLPYDFARCFHQLLRDCNLTENHKGQKFNLYALRHTYITQQILAKVPLSIIAEAVGNSPKIIQEWYSHVFAFDKAEAFDSIIPIDFYFNKELIGIFPDLENPYVRAKLLGNNDIRSRQELAVLVEKLLAKE